MSFKDHPVFDDHSEVHEGTGAVIIGFADRVVRRSEPTASTALPVADISLQRTAARLAKLDPDEWCLLQHPSMGPDHVVIGTRGVYAVTTTRLVGSVLVAGGIMLHNGHATDYLSRVRAEAQRVSTRLATAVRPLLVVDSEALTVREEPVDVGVTSSHRVRKWLERQPQSIERDAVFRVTAAAQRPRTWRY